MANLIFSFICTLLLFQSPADQIVGKWISSDKEVKIETYYKDQKLYGKIIWFREDPDRDKHPYDYKNPDPKLRKRKILGLDVLSGFSFDAKSLRWKKGFIYHPQHGKTFKGQMWLENNSTLKIRGYWGLLYRTNTWTRIQ